MLSSTGSAVLCCPNEVQESLGWSKGQQASHLCSLSQCPSGWCCKIPDGPELFCWEPREDRPRPGMGLLVPLNLPWHWTGPCFLITKRSLSAQLPGVLLIGSFVWVLRTPSTRHTVGMLLIHFALVFYKHKSIIHIFYNKWPKVTGLWS